MKDNRILVTTDGSMRSLRVFPHVALFAKATQSEVFLLRVLNPAKDVERVSGAPAHRAVKSTAERLEHELETVIDAFYPAAEPKVTAMRKGERVHDSILRIADELQANMIALSSRGSGMLRRAVLGSVATKILRCSMLPVFTAGPMLEKARKQRTYRVLATSDGSPASRRVLDVIDPFIASDAVSLELLRVYVSTFADREERVELGECRRQIQALRKGLLSRTRVRCHVSPLRGLDTVEGEILSLAQQVRVGAIAMSTHGHSARHHLLVGSKALGVLARSPLPVILARSKLAAGCQ